MPEPVLTVPSAAGEEAARKAGPAVIAEPSPAIVAQIETSRRLALEDAVRRGAVANPDQAAADLRASRASGLPVDVVRDAPDEVRSGLAAQAAGIDTLAKEHPGLARWLLRPLHAEASSDDLPVLRRLDRAFRQVSAGPNDDPLGYLPPGFQFDPRHGIIRRRGDQADRVGGFPELRQEMQDTAVRYSFLAEDAADRAQRVGIFANPAVSGALSALWSWMPEQRTDPTSGIGAALDVAAQSSAEQFQGWGWDLTRSASGFVADLPAMALGGGVVAKGAQTLMTMARTRRALVPFLGQAGTRYAEGAARVAAFSQPIAIREGRQTADKGDLGDGAMAWAIESLVPAAFGRTGIERALVPGVDKLAGAALWQAPARRLAKDIGLEATDEMATELAHAMHEYHSGLDPTALDGDKLMHRLTIAGTLGGLAGGALNLPAARQRQLAMQSANLRASSREASTLAQAFDAALVSKTRERDPEAVRELMQSLPGGEDARVYFETSAWAEHFGKAGQDPTVVAQAYGIPPEVYARAAATGQPLAVPAARFLASATEGERALLARATLRPDALAPADLEPALAAARKEIEGAASAASAPAAELDASAERVAQVIATQLESVGTAPDAAQFQAQQQARFFRTLAARYGGTPEGLFKHYMRPIQGDGAQVFQRARKVDSLDVLLGQLKAGEVPDERAVRGPTLAEFLRSQGGIADTGGELATLEPDRAGGPRRAGERSLINPEGIGLDQARELAIEAGYDLPEDSINGLLDALRDDLGGRAVYRAGEGDPVLGARRDALGELRAMLESQGVDPASAGIEQMRAAVDAAEKARVGASLDQPAGAGKRQVDQQKLEAARKQLSETVSLAVPSGPVVINPVRLNGGEVAAPDAKAQRLALGGPPPKRAIFADMQRVMDAAVLVERGIPDEANRPSLSMDVYVVRVDTGRGPVDHVVFIRRSGGRPFIHDVGMVEPPATASGPAPDLGAGGVDATAGGSGDSLPENGQPSSYEQPARGKIIVGKDVALTIHILRTADLSTFLHESAHAYLEIITDLAKNPDAPQALRDDLDKVRAWVGNDGGAWTVPQHEQFARGFEAYLMEGKAPSQALRRAFAAFRSWLVTIYRTLRGLDVTLTPEVRGVMDRLIATDEEIEAAAESMGARPLWADAQAAGMTAQQWAKYLPLAEQVRTAAMDSLSGEVLEIERKARNDAWKQARERIRSEVEAEANARPEFIALRALQDGALPEGFAIPEGAKVKLDRADLVRRYGETILGELPGPKRPGVPDLPNAGRRIYATEGGMPVDVAASLFGFRSPDALILALQNAPDRTSVIESETDKRTRAEFGDPLLDGSLEPSARAFVASEMAGTLLAEEVAHLSRRLGEEPPAEAALRTAAQEQVSRTKARDLRPDVFRAAADKAGREAFDLAAKARDKAPENQRDRGIYLAKTRQLFNLHLYRAAVQAQQDGDEGRTYLRRFDTLTKRQELGKAGGWEWTVYAADGSVLAVHQKGEEAEEAARAAGQGATFARTQGYLDQIDALLEQYELRRASTRQLRRRESLRQWIQRQQQDGEPIDLPDHVIDDLGRRNWNDLTIEEQREVVGSIRQIEHLARLKNRLLKAQRERTMEAARTALVGTEQEPGSIPANKPTKERRRESRTELEKAIDGFGAFIGAHRKDSFLAREMDGGKDGGPAWELLIRPRNEAAAEESQELIEATRTRAEALRAWGKSPGLVRQNIAGTRLRLTNEQRIGLALNWGNLEGRQRVLVSLAQAGYTASDAHAVIDSLDAADWDLVRATWAQVNAYWPRIVHLEQRTTGLPPEKVEALPFRSAAGMQPGGYYPIKYDQTLSNKAGDLQAATEAKDRLRAANLAARTRRGFTRQRAREVSGQGLRMDFGVVAEHLGEVIHDLTHREALMDQNRLLRDKDISRAIIEHHGRAAYDQLINTAADIAVGDAPAKSQVERMTRALRRNLSASVFGFNLTSAISNTTGFMQSIVRVGPARMLEALARTFRDASHLEATATWVRGKSSFMDTRATTWMREIAEANRSVGAKGLMDSVQRWGMYPMAKTQQAIDTVTWVAAYQKSLDESHAAGLDEAAAEAKAVQVADQTVVDTQGSGRLGDLAAIQRGGELAKLLTVFYSYFSVTYNLQRQSLVLTARGQQSAFKLATDTLLLWTLPAVLTAMIGRALRGDDDDKDQEAMWKRLAKDQATYGMGMLVGLRELSGFLDKRSYGGPAGLRSFDLFNDAGLQLMQGEADAAMLKSLVGLTGILGVPAVEANRIVDGMTQAWEGGDTGEALRAALFGKPRR